MNLLIYKNGQQHGPYSVEQLNDWLLSGQVHPSDMACYEGSTVWAPLNTLSNLGIRAPAFAPQTAPRSEGWGLIIGGAVIDLIGALLCVTVIGAIVGIPMMIGGTVMIWSGRLRYSRSVTERLKQSITEGIVQGMQPAFVRNSGPLPPQTYAPPPAAAREVPLQLEANNDVLN